MPQEENKNNNSGTTIFMVILGIVCLTIILIGNKDFGSQSSTSVQQPEVKEWYQGGTLHKAKILGMEASYRS